MSSLVRQLAMIAALVAAMIVAVGWSASVMASRRAEAIVTATDVAACRQLAGGIEALRSEPALVGSAAKDMSELVKSIEASARRANIAADSLVRIWPQPARHLGAGHLVEMPTQVDLRLVSLKQVVEFLYELSRCESSLVARQLRLSAAPRTEAGGHWAAETTLVYLVYEPPSTTTPSGQ